MGTSVVGDQRQDPRLPPPPGSPAATLKILGSSADAIPGVEIVNLSGRGLKLSSPQPVAPGQLVEVDWNNALLLGEVTYAMADPSGGRFAIGVALEHYLPQLDSVAALRNRFLAEQLAA